MKYNQPKRNELPETFTIDKNHHISPFAWVSILDAYRSLIKQLEWNGGFNEFGYTCCPACQGDKNNHKDSCILQMSILNEELFIKAFEESAENKNAFEQALKESEKDW